MIDYWDLLSLRFRLFFRGKSDKDLVDEVEVSFNMIT